MRRPFFDAAVNRRRDANAPSLGFKLVCVEPTVRGGQPGRGAVERFDSVKRRAVALLPKPACSALSDVKFGRGGRRNADRNETRFGVRKTAVVGIVNVDDGREYDERLKRVVGEIAKAGRTINDENGACARRRAFELRDAVVGQRPVGSLCKRTGCAAAIIIGRFRFVIGVPKDEVARRLSVVINLGAAEVCEFRDFDAVIVPTRFRRRVNDRFERFAVPIERGFVNGRRRVVDWLRRVVNRSIIALPLGVESVF